MTAEQIQQSPLTEEEYQAQCKADHMHLSDTLMRLMSGRNLGVSTNATCDVLYVIAQQLDQENRAFVVSQLDRLARAITELPTNEQDASKLN